MTSLSEYYVSAVVFVVGTDCVIVAVSRPALAGTSDMEVDDRPH